MMKSKYSLWVLMFFFISCASPNSGKLVFEKEISLNDITPLGIVAMQDKLWLSDPEQNRLVCINYSGKLIKQFDGFKRPMHISRQQSTLYIPEMLSDTIKTFDLNSEEIQTLDLKSTLDAPAGVAIQDSLIAIADFYNHRIVLQKEEKTIFIGHEGHEDGALYYPTDVSLTNNLLFVADAYNNRLQVFDLEGNYVRMIGWQENINVASGIAITEQQVFITDFYGNRLLIYDHYGQLQQILTKNLNHPTDVSIVGNHIFVANNGSKSIAMFKFQ